jgi:hypothetical protein
MVLESFIISCLIIVLGFLPKREHSIISVLSLSTSAWIGPSNKEPHVYSLPFSCRPAPHHIGTNPWSIQPTPLTPIAEIPPPQKYKNKNTNLCNIFSHPATPRLKSKRRSERLHTKVGAEAALNKRHECEDVEDGGEGKSQPDRKPGPKRAAAKKKFTGEEGVEVRQARRQAREQRRAACQASKANQMRFASLV